MAELSGAEKDAISHRGRAARALREWLEGRAVRP
jgi:inosine/xanthosine triphosphate pyrophosphatase family protein